MKVVTVGILGANSFAGRELVMLLLKHSRVKIAWLTSESRTGTDYSQIFPEFTGRLSGPEGKLHSLSEVTKGKKPAVVFSCLHHGHSAENLKPFIEDRTTKVIDLSADFRFTNLGTYEVTYGVSHPLPKAAAKSSYGLCELNGKKIRSASLIGNPGCYPTSILLPLVPLIKDKLISASGIIADSKSGVSGAGKKPSENTHYVTANESLSAYMVGDQHRHLPEIIEQLKSLTGTRADVVFTPHLVPMERGILSTIYCDLKAGTTGKKITASLKRAYGTSGFVKLVSAVPGTAQVRGSNFCHIYFHIAAKKLILISVIDNLVKGASGQAVQNLNLLFGFSLTEGLL